MQENIQLLYTVFFIISVLTGFMMLIFYLHHNKNKRFGYALIIWSANLTALFLDALNPSFNAKLPIIAFWPDYLCSLGGVLLMGSIFSIPISIKKLFSLFLITYLLGILIYFIYPTFTAVALPMTLGVAIPLIHMGIKCFIKENRNIIYDLYLWINIIWGLHFLDYAFLRPDPQMAVFGFSFSFIISLIISIMFPFIINMKLKEESEDILNSRIEEKKEELKLTVSDLITAQTKILEQEKFISLATLSSGIAHEIRNPLNIILNSAKIMERNFDIDPKANEFLELILKNTERANNIIKNMLLKTNNFSDKTELWELINLKRLVSECFEKINFDQTSEFAPRIHYKLDIPSDYSIKGKKTDLDSIFLNLIVNAIYSLREKFQKGIPSEELTLQINSFKKEKGLIIEFVDNGMGIKDENINKIFDPFFTTKPSGIGTGLGLSIIKIMVEALGGKIDLESKHLEYCKFTLFFPKEY